MAQISADWYWLTQFRCKAPCIFTNDLLLNMFAYMHLSKSVCLLVWDLYANFTMGH